MTTYKLVLIPHRTARKGSHGHVISMGGTRGSGADDRVATEVDERYLPFGHLVKEYLQVWTRLSSYQSCFSGFL